MTVLQDFTAVDQVSSPITVNKGDYLALNIGGDGVGTLYVQKSITPNIWDNVQLLTAYGTYRFNIDHDCQYRLAVRTYVSGTVETRMDVRKKENVKKKKIAALADSMSSQSYAWDKMWPALMENTLNQNGVPCEVKAFAINAHSFYRANTTVSFGDKTALEHCVNWNPDVVLVPMGHNDVVSDIDSRSIAQVQDDATRTFSTLRNLLPTAEIYYLAQSAYDRDNFTGAGLTGLKNKAILPSDWQFKTTGILVGTYNTQIVEDPVSASSISDFQDFETLDTHINSLTTIDGAVTLDTWKIARLGTVSTDGTHFNDEGHKLIAGSVISRLLDINAPFLNDLADQLLPEWSDPLDIFDNYMTASGDGWVTSWPTDDGEAATSSNLGKSFKPDVWYYPYKAVFEFYPNKVTNDSTVTSMFNWSVKGARPLTPVELSIAGAAFTGTGTSRYNDGVEIITDIAGNASHIATVGPLGFTNGTYELYFKIGNEVFGPYSLEIAATVP